jgi:prepilin-type processing-associated H-X9-DG protein
MSIMQHTHPFGRRVLAWHLGSLAGVALAALTALLVANASASSADDQGLDKDTVTVTPELAWVRPDAAAFAVVRPAALWDSPEGKVLREQFPRIAEDLERDVEREVGMRPAEMESVIAVVPDFSFLRGGGGVKKAGGAGDFPKEFKDPPREFKELPKELKEFKDPPKGVKDQPPANSPAAAQPDRDHESPVFLVATASDPATLARLQKEVQGKATAHKHNDKTYYVLNDDREHREFRAFYFINDRSVVRGGVKQIQKGLERTDTETKGALAPALRMAKGKHHLVVGLQLGEKEGLDLLDEMCRYQRGLRRTLLPLFRARAAAGVADVGKQTHAEVEVFFRDGSQVKAGLAAAEDALTLLRVHGLNEIIGSLEENELDSDDPRREQEAMFGIQVLEQLEMGLRRFKADTKGGLLRVAAQASTDLAAMAGKTKELLKARAADETLMAAKWRRKSQNNLRQIGTALHAMHDSYRQFPPAAICDNQGKQLLSWRVAILPFIGHGDLFNQFKRDEPWDSPHNIKLLAQMPAVFAPVGIKTKDPGMTFYQGFIADPRLGAEHQTAWETMVAADTPFGAWGPRLPGSFPDGTSLTLWVVEAGDAVPWTKPVDLPYDPKQPLPKLGGLFKEGYNILFVDGSVRFAPRDFDEKTLRLLITRADGQPIGPEFERLR